ncbi:MAG: 3-deoxy-7-phosphoheptulonate synthase [Spirochaetota bacterium]
MQKTSDVRIQSLDPLVPPVALKEEVPASEASLLTVLESRRVIESILSGNDPRMLAVVGPCSIHDPEAALDYARRLKRLHDELEDRIYLVMRVYFEKPRTRLGWRGLILDPHLDGSYDIQTGLRTARRLLGEITNMGLPTGSEMLDPIVPQYTDDLTSWASIGARTIESQTHREMASGLSMPVGFKNSTDGSIEVAVNALASSRNPHSFIGIDPEGRTCVLNTTGNEFGHVILRGGRTGPNYHDESVEEAVSMLEKAGYPPAVMIDCSHSNSLKDPSRQQKILRSAVRQRREGQDALVGVMIESNIGYGRQDIPENRADLLYGVSITDPCIDWDTTEESLRSAYAQLGSTARVPG